MKPTIILAGLLTLSGCGYSDSRMAHQAQINMVGMTLADLQSCAGVADRSTRIDDRTQILTYAVDNDSAGGIEVTLPVIGGGYTVGGSGSRCNANFRIEDNKVASLFYSGNNDRPIGEDGVCAPIIRGCMRRPQASMIPLNDETRALSSAYWQPPAPEPRPQPEGVARMPTVGR
jgi:hypothetical protein